MVRAGLSTAIQGGRFDKQLLENLRGVGVSQVLAGVQGAIGDLTDGTGARDLPVMNMIAHALAGGLAAKATGGKFEAGAAAALSSAIAANAGLFSGLSQNQLSAVSQLIGAAAALLAGGDGADVNQGASIAQSAAFYNYLTHENLKDLLAELKACKAKPTGCSQKERARIAEKWRRISLENDKRLALLCADWTCVAAALKQKVDRFQGYDAVASVDKQVASYLYNTYGFDILQPAWEQVQRNIRFRKDYENYVQVKCGGISSPECAADHLKAWEDLQGKLALAERAKLLLAVTLTGGLAARALASKAVEAVKSCLGNPACINELGIALGEAAAGEALGGGMLAITVASGSRLVLKKGDMVVGLIDETLGHLTAVNPTSRGVPMFRAADSGLYVLENSGQLRAAIKFPSQRAQLMHIFRPKHNIIDSPENRLMLLEVANNPAYRMGIGQYGKEVYAYTRSDGSQIWVEVMNGIIQNAGINMRPGVFVPGKGIVQR